MTRSSAHVAGVARVRDADDDAGMNACDFELWAWLASKHGGPADPRRAELSYRRTDALAFVRAGAPGAALDEIEVDGFGTMLAWAAATDEELALALLAAGASPNRAFATPGRDDAACETSLLMH